MRRTKVCIVYNVSAGYPTHLQCLQQQLGFGSSCRSSCSSTSSVRSRSARLNHHCSHYTSCNFAMALLSIRQRTLSFNQVPLACAHHICANLATTTGCCCCSVCRPPWGQPSCKPRAAAPEPPLPQPPPPSLQPLSSRSADVASAPPCSGQCRQPPAVGLGAPQLS
jgi:hypothetical protein